jgi:hypothetical protein
MAGKTMKARRPARLSPGVSLFQSRRQRRSPSQPWRPDNPGKRLTPSQYLDGGIDQILDNSARLTKGNLELNQQFKPLPKEFGLAVIELVHRLALKQPFSQR